MRSVPGFSVVRSVSAWTNFTDEISTKGFSLSAKAGVWHAPAFAGRGEEMLGKGAGHGLKKRS